MSLLLNAADPLGPRSRGGCRSCAAEAAGASGVATVLLSLATVVCRAARLLQMLQGWRNHAGPAAAVEHAEGSGADTGA